MADAKISALVELLGSELDVAADRIPVVDTSEAQSKYIEPHELFANPIFAGVCKIAAGSAAAPALACTTDTNTGIYFGAADEIDLSIGGVKRFALAATGELQLTATLSESNTLTEALTNGTCTTSLSGWTAGAGWAYDADTAKHTAGNTATLTNAFTSLDAAVYLVAVTITGRTAGSVTASFTSGRDSYAGKTATFTVAIKSTAAGANALVITPTTDFDGAIDTASVKRISAPTTALHLLNSAGGSGGWQFLAGGTGLYNQFAGSGAGACIVSGTNNIGLGVGVLAENVSGTHNIGVGIAALNNVLTGVGNIGIGVDAGRSLVDTSYNIAIGYSAMSASIGSWYNIAIGMECLYHTTTGQYNVAIGSNAVHNISTGSQNTGVGRNALYNNTTGSNNVGIGYAAGRYRGSGTDTLLDPENSIYIGYNSRGAADTDSNSIVIGTEALGLGPNTTVIGADATHLLTQLGGALQLTNTAAAPTNGADKAHLYCADQAGGNACMFTKTENGAVIKLFQGAAVADATGAGDVVAQLNALLARLRAHGLIAT